jgi:hypothetical protein
MQVRTDAMAAVKTPSVRGAAAHRQRREDSHNSPLQYLQADTATKKPSKVTALLELNQQAVGCSN